MDYDWEAGLGNFLGNLGNAAVNFGSAYGQTLLQREALENQFELELMKRKLRLSQAQPLNMTTLLLIGGAVVLIVLLKK